MTDREKVIKALECCAGDDVNLCDNCPYLGCSPDRYCFGNMAADVLALLKAQEPVAVHVFTVIDKRKTGDCPNCGRFISTADHPKYCGFCGQAVKWE